jgi:hypothetical protein
MQRSPTAGAELGGVLTALELALQPAVAVRPDAGDLESDAARYCDLGEPGAAAGLVLGQPCLDIVGVAQVVLGRVTVRDGARKVE